MRNKETCPLALNEHKLTAMGFETVETVKDASFVVVNPRLKSWV